MPTDTLRLPAVEEHALGMLLKNCRARLDPSSFGFTAAWRRPPGPRREEVGQLARVSATWYTWLEQGRGDAQRLRDMLA